MGAYEYQGLGMSEFIGWLGEYSLPTDGSADQGDPDGDGTQTDAEYAADTNPTNKESVLIITGIELESQGIRVGWKGGTGVWQYLEYRTVLAGTGQAADGGADRVIAGDSHSARPDDLSTGLPAAG